MSARIMTHSSTASQRPKGEAAEPSSGGPVIRVGIVEDDDRIRQSLVTIMDATPGFRCISASGNTEEALACPWLGQADVVLMDINLPSRSGIECTRELKARHPALQIKMLTVYEDAERIFESLRSGATGYLLKRTPPTELLAAIRDLHQGGSPMSGRVARKVVAAFSASFRSLAPRASDTPKQAVRPAVALTPKEHAILEKLSQGFQYKEIAEQLDVSINTVRTHLRSIYEKLHVQNRTEAAVKFLGT